MLRFILVLSLFLCATAMPSAQAAAKGDFDTWLKGVKTEAKKNGISQGTLEKAFEGVRPIKRVIELDRKQPEGTMTFAKYRKNVISDARIAQGRRMMKEHKTLLERVSKQYDVPPQYIVALWGIETSYGNNTGGFDVIAALATLAYDGRRSKFFREELMGALKILEGGHITHAKMRGSWAGAMGQNQFMPSSFHRFAVDGNGDKKRDIWTSLPDVFSSTANYLSKSGWSGDERWGRAVKIPASFQKDMVGIDIQRSLKEWHKLGVRLPDGSSLPNAEGLKAAIVTPGGIEGPAFLVYGNYRVIMKWNKSTYFATSVGLLADQIAQP